MNSERLHPFGSLYSHGFARLAAFDAIYLGAIGAPTVPDHISAGDLLLPAGRRSVSGLLLGQFLQGLALERAHRLSSRPRRSLHDRLSLGSVSGS